MQDKLVKNILVLFAAVLIFYLLNLLASILLPLVLALLFAILVQPFINYSTQKGLPKWLILPTVSIITFAVLFVIGIIISNTVSSIIDEQNFLLSRFLSKIDSLLVWYNDTFDAKLDTTLLVSEIYKILDEDAISKILSILASDIGSFFSSFLFFALYYVMLISGMSNYQKYLSYVGGDKGKEFLSEYENISKSIFSYMWIKVIINLCTGLLTYLFCAIFEIKFGVFWGFFAFLLSFIPNIGSIISTILPILMSVIQLDSLADISLFSISLIGMHFVIGNLLEPIIMGNRLRLNTLTVLFGLVFWGYIWGIPGMILSVPLLVIMKILFERSNEYSVVARLMGFPE